MPRFRIFTPAAVLLGTLGLVAAPAVAANRSWSAPATLTANATEGGTSQVSLAEDGDAISLWAIGYNVKGLVRRAGVSPLIEEPHEVVQAAIRPNGGSYGPDQTLSNPSASAYADGVATAANGEAIAVWDQDQVGESKVGEKTEIEYAVRPAGASTFGTPAVLTETGLPDGGASVAMNPAGEAVIAWTAAAESEVQYVTRSATGTFSAVGTVKASTGVGFDDVYAAIDAKGDAVISWNADAEPSHETYTGAIEAIQRPAGGAFGAPVDVSGADLQDYSPRPAIDGSGDVTLVWIAEGEDPETKKAGYKVQARTLSSVGGLGKAVQTLSSFGTLPEEPRIGVDAAGEATAVWTHVVGSTVAAEADVMPSAGGSFEQPATVLDASAGMFSSDAVAVSETGEAMALWAHSLSSETDSEQLVEATRTSGGSFGAAVPVSGAGPGFYGPSLALDSSGDGAASWFAFGEGALFVQASNFVVPAAPVIKETPGGSSPPPTTITTTSTKPFAITLRLTKPSLAKLRKGTAIKVTCTLTAAGVCTVHLLIAAANARKLGFHVAKHAKTVTIATLKITLSAAGAKVGSLKLSPSALRVIKRDHRPLSLQVSASAISTGGVSATLRPLALKIH